MKRILLITLSGFLLAILSSAQIPPGTAAQPQPATPPTQQIPEPSAPQMSAPQANHAKIAPGSVIPVQLTKTIDAKKAKTGDEVLARVTMDMKTSTGEVFIPKDTKVVGHVTEAQARSKEQKESQMGIVFDRAVMKDGKEVNLPMSIQAVVAPLENNPPSSGGDYGGDNRPAAGGGTTTSPMVGRAPLSPPSQPQAVPAGGGDAQASAGARLPINASTQGVIGIRDLKLEANTQNAAQGSVMSSQKSNVKLESGTVLLLKVNQ